MYPPLTLSESSDPRSNPPLNDMMFKSAAALFGNSNTGPEIDRPYVLKILIRSGSVRGPFGVRSESVRGLSGSVRGPFGLHSGSIRGSFGPFGVRSGSVRGRKILKVKGQFPKGRYLNSRI